MARKTETNYEKYRERLVHLIAQGALCHDCLARSLCRKICENRKINVSTSQAPCREAWEEWCGSRVE